MCIVHIWCWRQQLCPAWPWRPSIICSRPHLPQRLHPFLCCRPMVWQCSISQLQVRTRKGCAAVLNDRSWEALCKMSDVGMTTVASTPACPTLVMWLSLTHMGMMLILIYFTYAVVSEFAGDSKAASAWTRAHSVAQNAMLIARVRS